MRTTLKRCIRIFLNNDIIWLTVKLTLGTVSRAYNRLENIRKYDPVDAEKYRVLETKCGQIFPNLKVLNGPFKGMQYPGRITICSTFYPKILGSYEKELHSIIHHIARQPYTAIVDVGCAEGYYAVGLGMLFKEAQIYAFDTNETAINLCRAMAKINNVDVKLGGFCDKETIVRLKLGSRALIVCDCEGYENRLFDENIANRLSNHDFLIETHDFIDINTTKNISGIFSKTHNLEIVESIDDTIKAYTYVFEELNGLNLDERRGILGEGRPGIMKWIFAKSKSVPA